MRRLIAFLALFIFAVSMVSASNQWTGYITDLRCARAGSFTGDHTKCVEQGSPIVFVDESTKKIYALSDQDKAKPHLGQKVMLEGSLSGDKIEVEKIAPAS